MSSALQDEPSQDSNQTEQNASMRAAIARTLTRGLALYFARPVRLFRPSKINGWQSLRSMAEHQGKVFDHKFLLSVVKLQGLGVFRKHFFPPMVVNAVLGTVLWATYAESYSMIGPAMLNYPIFAAAVSGGIAGGAQALVAAPVENVRFVIEGGRVGYSWTEAWRDIIRDSPNSPPESPKSNLREARELRNWMKEVGGMAGRGWNGWGWGCAKDICAFSAFFTIFEVTRRVGQAAKSHSGDLLSYIDISRTRLKPMKEQVPRVLNSVILVSGGVLAGLAYEAICRPWDRARRLIYLGNLESGRRSGMFRPILEAIRADGPVVLLRDPSPEPLASPGPQGKLARVLRTLGRVGPWGVGFLVWEVYGPGLP